MYKLSPKDIFNITRMKNDPGKRDPQDIKASQAGMSGMRTKHTLPSSVVLRISQHTYENYIQNARATFDREEITLFHPKIKVLKNLNWLGDNSLLTLAVLSFHHNSKTVPESRGYVLY